MRDFSVVYQHPYLGTTIFSRVYAIENQCFPIANIDGKFEWVHMDYCTLEDSRRDSN